MFLACLFVFAQQLTPNGDVERTYRRLVSFLAMPIATNQQINHALEDLEAAVLKEHRSRVNLGEGPIVTLESEDGRLFEKPPILPAEVKEGDRWFFERHRFAIRPDNLYVYQVRIKGTRTLRIREIVFYFRDGGKRVHRPWFHLENGNGQAFSKRQYSEALPVWEEGAPRRARALAAIEILGSAQDYEHASMLQCVLVLPDPTVRPFQDALDGIRKIRQQWQKDSDRHKLWRDLSAWETLRP